MNAPLAVALALAIGSGCARLDMRVDVTPIAPAPTTSASVAREDVRVVFDARPTDAKPIATIHIEADKGLFPGYADPWRRAYCYPQRILVIVTLFLWELVPIYYPCQTKLFYPTPELRAALVEQVAAMGGTIVYARFVDEDEGEARGVFGEVVVVREPD